MINFMKLAKNALVIISHGHIRHGTIEKKSSASSLI